MSWFSLAWSFAGAVLVWFAIVTIFGFSIASNVAQTALVYGVFMVLVGLGQMLVITSGVGNIDLSVPSTIALAGCSAYTQTTSGQDWLAAYPPGPPAKGGDIDARVRAAAAVEPTLRFPARIGIARIGKQLLGKLREPVNHS